MVREAGIRERIGPIIDILVQYYEETDPALGEKTSVAKLEVAQHAIFLWWKLYDELMVWAQSQLAGYCIALENPGVTDLFEHENGTELHADEHFLEHLGQLFVRGGVLPENEGAERFVETYLDEAKAHGLDQYKEREALIHPVVLRQLMYELLSGDAEGSKFWRLPARSGLRHLNEWQKHPIFEPRAGQKMGQPFDLKRWKLAALEVVHFRVGLGFRKGKAEQYVADGIGQAVETLRDWEKNDLTDEFSRVSLECARLAGELHEQLTRDPSLEPLNAADYPVYRNRSYLHLALGIHRVLHNRSLDAIREGIRQSRIKKSSG